MLEYDKIKSQIKKLTALGLSHGDYRWVESAVLMLFLVVQNRSVLPNCLVVQNSLVVLNC